MKKSEPKSFIKQYGLKISAICFWLLFWEILSRSIDKEILLPSPFTVVVTLFGLVQSISFWQTILYSFTRIVLGFFLAISVGTVLAILSFRNLIIRELVLPIMQIVKATPVVSFIILALIWIKAINLSILISFLMVLPIIYTNVGQGLATADEKLLQMAEVFRVGRLKKIRAIYIPQIVPYFVSAISVGLGFCWKSGIAAEVIAFPSGSIGRQLYEAKLYFMTKELFAWTVVIILISILFEKVVMWFIKRLQRDV